MSGIESDMLAAEAITIIMPNATFSQKGSETRRRRHVRAEEHASLSSFVTALYLVLETAR